MVPSTPRGELADILRRVLQAEAASNKDMNFKIVESGGRTVKSLISLSFVRNAADYYIVFLNTIKTARLRN